MQEDLREEGMQGLSWTVMTGKKPPSLVPAFHSLEFILGLFKGTEEHKLLFFFQLLKAEVKSRNHTVPDCLNVHKSM